MIGRVAAFVAGVVAAPFAVTAILRLLETNWAVLAIGAAVVLAGVLKGGLLRWAAAGFAVGVIGWEAVLLWALDNLDSGGV